MYEGATMKNLWTEVWIYELRMYEPTMNYIMELPMYVHTYEYEIIMYVLIFI